MMPINSIQTYKKLHPTASKLCKLIV